MRRTKLRFATFEQGGCLYTDIIYVEHILMHYKRSRVEAPKRSTPIAGLAPGNLTDHSLDAGVLPCGQMDFPCTFITPELNPA